MIIRADLRWLARAVLCVVLLVLVAGIYGMAAANTVPETAIEDHAEAITANDLKPGECNSISLTVVRSGNGTVTGTNGNDLLLGTSASQNINGGNGDDCLVGGGGSDRLNGNNGFDICIGGPGATYTNCEIIYP